jgi:serine/threonine protein phosphatase PrpC
VKDVRAEELLQDGVQRANAAIYQRNLQKFVMGTTLTTALVSGSTAYVANVGDSRTYLYRASEGLTQITSDHSHVWQLFKEGCIKHEDIYTHPKRNEIYRCLGESARVEIDTFQVSLQAHDVLLLCTDGLWEMVRDAEIEHIMQDNMLHASQMSAKLIEAALRNGGADNVSAVVVCIDSDE